MKYKPWNVIFISIPLFFIYGWIITKEFFGNDINYLLLTMLATLLTIIIVLVFCRVNHLVQLAPLLMLFAVFILAYFLKFLIIVNLMINNEEEYIGYLVGPHIVEFLNKDNLLRSYKLAMYGYASFCFSVIITYFIAFRSSQYILIQNIASEFLKIKYIVIYLSVCFLLIVISSLLSINYRVGIHGGEAQELPFKLNAIIHYFRMFSFYFILLIVSWTDNKKHEMLWITSVGILAFYAISQIIVEASRGALMSSFAIPLGVLWFVSNKFSIKRWIFVLTSIALTMIFRPIFTVYRIIQNNFDLGIIANINELYNYKYYLDIGSMAYQGGYYLFNELLFRIIGIDSVLYFSNLTTENIDIPWIVSVILGTESFGGRFTQEIVGYGETVTTHYAAPSLIGGLYWMGGVIGIVIGVMIIAIISQFLWRRVINSNWMTNRLILIMIVFMVMRIGIEGAFDGTIREVFMSVVIAVFFEFICRSNNPFKIDAPARSHAVC